MPRRTKSIVTRPELIRRIGSPGVELRVLDRLDLDAPARARHKGWKWSCSCSAFVRPEGDGYLWVPCPGHTGNGAESS